MDKFETLKDVRVSHAYTTDSAFLYNSYYITPCILKAVINEYLRQVEPKQLHDFMITYGYKNSKSITEDLMHDYFVNGSVEKMNKLSIA